MAANKLDRLCGQLFRVTSSIRSPRLQTPSRASLSVLTSVRRFVLSVVVCGSGQQQRFFLHCIIKINIIKINISRLLVNNFQHCFYKCMYTPIIATRQTSVI